jgi:hypothetical protein
VKTFVHEREYDSPAWTWGGPVRTGAAGAQAVPGASGAQAAARAAIRAAPKIGRKSREFELILL